MSTMTRLTLALLAVNTAAVSLLAWRVLTPRQPESAALSNEQLLAEVASLREDLHRILIASSTASGLPRPTAGVIPVAAPASTKDTPVTGITAAAPLTDDQETALAD